MTAPVSAPANQLSSPLDDRSLRDKQEHLQTMPCVAQGRSTAESVSATLEFLPQLPHGSLVRATLFAII
jgi:hypothetical protein